MNSYIGHRDQVTGVEEYRLVGDKGNGMRLLAAQRSLTKERNSNEVQY